MDNYGYLAAWVAARRTDGVPLRVLDYGCGQGRLVKMLRDQHIDCYGCDVFVNVGKPTREYLLEGSSFGSVIMDMPDGRIPFPDESFDVIVSNQVIEHVQDIESTLAELQRVAKPGGTFLSVFPHKGVWREGHCGVAFVHWFPKRSRLRLYYTTACRAVGFGYHKERFGSIRAWARDRCRYLDEQTFYRTLPELRRLYGRYFENLTHWEANYARQRFGGQLRVLAAMPDAALVALVRMAAGCVLSCEKKKPTRTVEEDRASISNSAIPRAQPRYSRTAW
jgi:ubiquinone/menaquinone biosynthesis C-methylase UbiE